jgi:hypothetical protein
MEFMAYYLISINFIFKLQVKMLTLNGQHFYIHLYSI